MVERVAAWVHARGWTLSAVQQRAVAAYCGGRSGLVHAPTGSGKTYAVWLGPLSEYCRQNGDAAFGGGHGAVGHRERTEPCRALWITPLRALATDTYRALLAPVADLGLPWSVELRTGESSASLRQKQRLRLPTLLITTPESLSLQLSYPEARARLATLQTVIVDEWHELLGTKRGVQTELALARLRRWNPQLRVWGLSATLGNLQQACDVLVGPCRAAEAELISDEARKPIEICTLIPDQIERLPWAGHLGTRMVDAVVERIAAARSTLLFTNTRSQSELWFRALQLARPDWLGQLAIHHGSLDRGLRQRVEALLKQGQVRCVVCTSSLDLGVDFAPVDQVIQVGSPKGVARLMQRAGRSGHQPGAVSRIVCVPAHAFELFEFAAARQALNDGQIEARAPLVKPLDVLVQHLITIGAGGGFAPAEMLDEVRDTFAYQSISDAEWGQALDFARRGGSSLAQYADFARLVPSADGLTIRSEALARRHRMSIGTINSDQALTVRWVRGGALGTIEESFIARLRPGDAFVFAGRTLELVRVRQMSAYVRKATALRGIVPRWNGSRFPLSTQLAGAVRGMLAAALARDVPHPEARAARGLVELQARWSKLPGQKALLIEQVCTPEGRHWFVYPFAGRTVQEGIAALLAYRIARHTPATITTVANDYGFELLSDAELPLDRSAWRALFAEGDLTSDLLACMNATELARRQFRDIARVAGLVFNGFPGAGKSSRQLQASSDLFFDVFREFDPKNLLLEQARREVFAQQLEYARLAETLRGMAAAPLRIVRCAQLSPLAFPLWAESLRANSVSSESWTQRVARMAAALEQAAQAGVRGDARIRVDRGRAAAPAAARRALAADAHAADRRRALRQSRHVS